MVQDAAASLPIACYIASIASTGAAFPNAARTTDATKVALLSVHNADNTSTRFLRAASADMGNVVALQPSWNRSQHQWRVILPLALKTISELLQRDRSIQLLIIELAVADIERVSSKRFENSVSRTLGSLRLIARNRSRAIVLVVRLESAGRSARETFVVLDAFNASPAGIVFFIGREEAKSRHVVAAFKNYPGYQADAVAVRLEAKLLPNGDRALITTWDAQARSSNPRHHRRQLTSRSESTKPLGAKSEICLARTPTLDRSGDLLAKKRRTSGMCQSVRRFASESTRRLCSGRW